jgi:hypothetical protein
LGLKNARMFMIYHFVKNIQYLKLKTIGTLINGEYTMSWKFISKKESCTEKDIALSIPGKLKLRTIEAEQ